MPRVLRRVPCGRLRRHLRTAGRHESALTCRPRRGSRRTCARAHGAASPS